MTSAFPHVGQWWDEKTTSASRPKSRIASLMWRDQVSASRTFAPRSV
jgi:hypothetical protein